MLTIYDSIEEFEIESGDWDLSYLSPEQFGDYPNNISAFFKICESRNVSNFRKSEVNVMYLRYKRDYIIEDIIN